MNRHLFALFALACSCAAAHAQPASGPATTKKSNDQLLKGVTTPAGFDMTVFAQPPKVNYPTCLTATPTGEVFIGIDEQGSLGRTKDRGRVVRCVDKDGDGVADEIKTFLKLDHPRGLIWDDAARALYVLHPPMLTRHTDDDNDGVADRSETLIDGLTNIKSLTERGADHTTNGIRLGIDGWIYIAVGDFGALDAVGADGTHLKLHGGGIVRVRTDGSGMETYVTGTRNIYDVAIDPLMNCFTRDNTNDGDGWNDRLTYNPPGAFHGYPTRCEVATFGSKAEPGTIRGDFGVSNSFNLIHGSDSPEAAQRELGLFFKPDELIDWQPASQAWVYDMGKGQPE